MDQLTVIPPALRVEDVCDYCHRSFTRARGTATCPNCGLDNVRATSLIESGMLTPGPERAVLPTPAPKSRRRRK